MMTARIPVDLLNPGQVFACVGLMEAAEVVCGPCEGAFEYVGAETQTTFRISTSGSPNPVEQVLRFLLVAQVRARAPLASPEAKAMSCQKWEVETVSSSSSAYPCARPDTPATLVAELYDEEGRTLRISHWGDSQRSGRDNVKYWAGAGGYPGAALTRDALELVRQVLPTLTSSATADPFSVSAPQSSSFRFDWRRDYVPLDVGFSPNEHAGAIVMVGYPLVELLAAIGLENARPDRPDSRDKLTYRYGVSSANLPTAFVRAVLGSQALNFQMRTFRMRLDWPGQEGQARCIVDAREEQTR